MEKKRAYSTSAARKAARTAIYHVLYGMQEHTYARRHFKRSNDPANDTTRRLSVFWEWEQAKAAWDRLSDIAAFSPSRKAMLEARLEALKHHRVGG